MSTSNKSKHKNIFVINVDQVNAQGFIEIFLHSSTLTERDTSRRPFQLRLRRRFFSLWNSRYLLKPECCVSLKSPSPYRQIHVQHNSQISNELSKCFNLFQNDMWDGEEMFDRSMERIKIQTCAGARLFALTFHWFPIGKQEKWIPLDGWKAATRLWRFNGNLNVS